MKIRNWFTQNLGWLFCEIGFTMLDADIEETDLRYKIGEKILHIGIWFYDFKK
jgi:hypothetical protein